MSGGLFNRTLTRMQSHNCTHPSPDQTPTDALRESNWLPVIHASIYIPSLNANKQQKRSYAVSLDVQNLIIRSHQPSTIHSRPSPLRILSYLAPSSISQHRQWPYHGWGCPDHFRILAVTKLDEMAGHCRRRVFVACRLKPSFFASHETRLVCLVGWTNIHLE